MATSHNMFLEALLQGAQEKARQKALLQEQLFQKQNHDDQVALEKQRMALDERKFSRASEQQDRQIEVQNKQIEESRKQREFENERQKQSDNLTIADQVNRGVLRPQAPTTTLPTGGALNPDMGRPAVHDSAGRQFVPQTPEEAATQKNHLNDVLQAHTIAGYRALVANLNVSQEEKDRLVTGAMLGHEIKPPTTDEEHTALVDKILKMNPKYANDPVAEMNARVNLERAWQMAKHPTEAASNALQGAHLKILQNKEKDEEAQRVGHAAYSRAWVQVLARHGGDRTDPSFNTDLNTALSAIHDAKGYDAKDPAMNDAAHAYALQRVESEMGKEAKPKEDIFADVQRAKAAKQGGGMVRGTPTVPPQAAPAPQGSAAPGLPGTQAPQPPPPTRLPTRPGASPIANPGFAPQGAMQPPQVPLGAPQDQGAAQDFLKLILGMTAPGQVG